jgi:hypothetical protein
MARAAKSCWYSLVAPCKNVGYNPTYMSDLILAELTDTAISLDLTVEQEGQGGVSGLTPTVAIRRSDDSSLYLDFDDFSFKSAGWVEKYADMVHTERGQYTYTLDITAVPDMLPGDYFSVEYHVDESGVVGDARDRLMVVTNLSDVPGSVWDEATNIHSTAGTFGAEVLTKLTPTQAAQLLDTYRVLGLDPTTPLIVSRTARSAGVGVSQVIEENVPVAGSVKVTRQ